MSPKAKMIIVAESKKMSRPTARDLRLSRKYRSDERKRRIVDETKISGGLGKDARYFFKEDDARAAQYVRAKSEMTRTGKSKEYLNRLRHVGCPHGKSKCRYCSTKS